MNSINRVSKVLLGVILLMITVLGIAHAGFFTVNTNDGIDQVGLPTAFLTDPASDVASNYDILNFWVFSDANPPTEFYFRAELSAYLPIESYLEARLDCNNNSNFDDPADVLVTYLPVSAGESDAVYPVSGDWGNTDTYLAIYGEPTSTTGAYEWRSPVGGGTVDWSACLSGQINVQLATVEGSGFTDVDVTASRGFDVPTAVTLQQIAPSSHEIQYPLIVGLLVLVGAAITAFLIRRGHTL